MGVGESCNPVPYCLVHGVFQGSRTTAYRRYFGSQQLHPLHVERLTRDVDFAHVNLALDSEQRACSGGGHSVLPRTGFSNDAGLTNAFSEQDLTHGVVDLVRARVA